MAAKIATTTKSTSYQPSVAMKPENLIASRGNRTANLVVAVVAVVLVVVAVVLVMVVVGGRSGRDGRGGGHGGFASGSQVAGGGRMEVAWPAGLWRDCRWPVAVALAQAARRRR